MRSTMMTMTTRNPFSDIRHPSRRMKGAGGPTRNSGSWRSHARSPGGRERAAAPRVATMASERATTPRDTCGG